MKNKDYIDTEVNGLKIIESFTKILSKRRRTYFKCICVCGKLFESRSENIKSGSARSCGCKTSKLHAKTITLPDNLGAVNIVYRHYKFSAKKKHLSFLLSIDQFKSLIDKNCYYCGVAPQLSKFLAGKVLYLLNYNGIDRRDNLIGYEIDNCVSCCSDCNRAKSDLSLEEFETWIARLMLHSMTMKNKP